MQIRVLAVGKKHESWVQEGIERYETRLRKPIRLQWQIVAHSQRGAEAARTDESSKLLEKIKDRDHVILLDERGVMHDSPGFARSLQKAGAGGASTPITIIIGGSYGVDERVRTRAQQVVSLSKLVFPHQLVRLVLVEQIYRAQEIIAGRGYHHE